MRDGVLNGDDQKIFERRKLREAMPKFEPLLDDRQASEFLGGIHPKTLQRLARNGQVPAYRIGRYWRYRASELDEWLRTKINSACQPARVNFTKETPK